VPASSLNKKTAIIIGAGFAGCSTANSLARRGWKVTLIESAADIASGASGNKQAVLQCRLAADLTPQSNFYLQSFLYTQRQLIALEARHRINWHGCGILMMLTDAHSRLRRLQEQPGQLYNERVLTNLTQKQASEIAEVTVKDEALWLPHGGWLDPKRLCAAYLDDKTSGSIDLITSTTVDSLNQTDEGWLVQKGGLDIASAETVVIANSFAAAQYQQTEFLPLIPVRGQISHIKSKAPIEDLASIVIADGYICPATDNSHAIGATYDNGESNCQSRSTDDEKNLLALDSAFCIGNLKNLEITDSRAAVRCNTTDYFPVVGAVPHYQNFQQQYSSLARNAKAKIENTAQYLKGLYINTGHGSYGLATCPLSAEYLASLIDNESLPVSVAVMDALSPARFIIRDLMRQRVNTKS
jgi:tRNA 5-methylaminomethyl-2-thiouridine biosynthesis bifunctional protein